MRVSEAIALYLSEREPEVSALTYRNIKQTLGRLADQHGNVELADLNAATLRLWRNGLKVSPTSAEKYLDRVRAFLNYARKAGWMDATPTVSRLHIPPERQLRLDLDQIKALPDQAKNKRDRAAIAVAIEWLLRGSEIAYLRVGHLRMVDGVADVRVMKAEGEFAWDEMPISDDLRYELDNYLHAYRMNIGRFPSSEDYLFPSLSYRITEGGRELCLHPDKPMAHPYLVVHRALDALGVAVEMRRGFHTIRRSMARIRYDALVAAGEEDPVGVVAALLHHQSRRTTELYLGVSGDRDRRNKIMRSSSWVSPLARATSAETDQSGLARVIRLRP
jgi:integrase